ncbi:unnamed protein product, partial [Mesorhabditis belari]|uniref:Annexin n=1 Tax=Mesorhabditis belari TaxID=2138241 RepID=A0AAF3EAN6_9BILA
MPNFGDLLMKGAKTVLDQQLNKRQNPNSASGGGGQNQYGGSSYDQANYNQQNSQQNNMSGFGGGYPQQDGYSGGGGYPQQNPYGYPSQQPPSGTYPAQGGQNSSYAGQNSPYPPSGGFPNQPYPPQSSAYPGQNQGGYPQIGLGGYQEMPSSGGYPSGGAGYNPNIGQPSQSMPSYPAAPTYPSMGSGFNSSGSFHQPPMHPMGTGGGAMFGNPSIRPIGSNANADAETLRKAMKGLGCDNAKVISVLCARTNMQRQEIARAFKVMYGKDLIQELKSELRGDFEDLIIALMTPPAQYDAQQLHRAMAGIGTKESVLIEIMTSRTNAQIFEIRNVYRAMYRSDLEKDLISETSGWFKRLLVSMCAGGRDENNFTDPLRANQDARKLYAAGERRLGTDEACFNSILAAQNYAQLRLVFDEYQKVSNHSIEQAIDAEFSGDIRDGMMALCTVIRNRGAYFAKLLHDSMKGLGTRDNDLIRLVVTRSEIDLGDVRNEFQRLYKTPLENMIKGDCSGSYKDGLIALVHGNQGAQHF